MFYNLCFKLKFAFKAFNAFFIVLLLILPCHSSSLISEAEEMEALVDSPLGNNSTLQSHGLDLISKEGQEMEALVDSSLGNNSTLQITSYLQEVLSEQEKSKKIKTSIAASLAILSNTSLFFLSQDMIQQVTGSQLFGYIAGPASQIPFIYITYDLIYNLLSQIQKSHNPVWRDIYDNLSHRDKIKLWVEQISYYCMGTVSSAVSIYYSDKYLSPLIGEFKWIIIIPTLIGQTILGAEITKLSARAFINEIKEKYLYAYLSDKSKKIFDVKKKIKFIISQLKEFTPEEIDNLFDNLQKGIFDMLPSIYETEQATLCQKTTRLLLGASGCIIGIIGPYVMVKATEVAMSWMLKGISGLDENFISTTSMVTGYLGGITAAALKGYGTISTFYDLYGYFGDLVKYFRNKIQITKVRFLSDTVSLILGVIATSPRIKIIVDNDLSPLGLRIIVTACTIISTASTNFFGWKGLFVRLFDGTSKKQEVIKSLKRIIDDLASMKQEVIDDLHNYLSNRSQQSM